MYHTSIFLLIISCICQENILGPVLEYLTVSNLIYPLKYAVFSCINSGQGQVI